MYGLKWQFKYPWECLFYHILLLYTQYGDSYMDDTDEHLLHEVFNKVDEMVCYYNVQIYMFTIARY